MAITATGGAIMGSRESGDSLRVMRDLITLKFRAGEAGGAFTLFEGVVAPGRGELPHVHERENETFYVLAGQVAFMVDEEWREVDAGSALHVPHGTLHGFRNRGASEARLLVLNAPGGLHEELFAAMSELTPPASPEQGAALVAVAARLGTMMLP